MNLKSSSEIAAELDETSKQLEKIKDEAIHNLQQLNKRRSLPFGRSKDYGKVKFMLELTFDEVNTADWQSISETLFKLFGKYQRLRKHQWSLEKDLQVKKIEDVAQSAVIDRPLVDFDKL